MSVISTKDQLMIWERQGWVAVEVRRGGGSVASEESTSIADGSDVISLLQTDCERETTPSEIVLAMGSGCEYDGGVEVEAW